jgi:hypothetical protein
MNHKLEEGDRARNSTNEAKLTLLYSSLPFVPFSSGQDLGIMTHRHSEPRIPVGLQLDLLAIRTC